MICWTLTSVFVLSAGETGTALVAAGTAWVTGTSTWPFRPMRRILLISTQSVPSFCGKSKHNKDVCCFFFYSTLVYNCTQAPSSGALWFLDTCLFHLSVMNQLCWQKSPSSLQHASLIAHLQLCTLVHFIFTTGPDEHHGQKLWMSENKNNTDSC